MTSRPAHQFSRRSALGMFGAVGASAFLAACAGPGSTAADKSTTSSTAAGSTAAGSSAANSSGGSADIVFTHWRGEDKAVFEKLIGQFQDKNPGIKVTQNISTSNDYQVQALQKLVNGGAGDVIASFPGGQLHDFIKANIETDLSTSGPTANYIANLITSGAVDGKQYGYPYQLLFLDPIANMDILSAAGYTESPTNWDDYLGMLDKIKSQGVTPMAFPGADAGNAGQLFNSMVMNAAPSDDMCAKIEAGDYKLTDEWFLTVLKYYQQLGPYVQAHAEGTAVEPAQQLFATGKAAMLTTGSYDIAAARGLGATFPINLAPPVTTAKGETPKYVAAYNATFILGVNQKSQHTDAAMAWLEFLSTTENAAVYANETSQFSPVKGITYTSDDLKALSPWLDKNTILAPRNNQYNNVDVRNTVEGACTQALIGGDINQIADKNQKTIDQIVSAAG